MAEKLKEYNSSNLAKLMMQKKRIETLINNMHDPVIGLDENKKVLFTNQEALKITGLKEDEIVGKDAQVVSVTNDLIRSLLQDIMLPENNSLKLKSAQLKIFADGKESYFEKEILNITIIPTGERASKTIGQSEQ
jgi:PAS domain S-box-containing protein